MKHLSMAAATVAAFTMMPLAASAVTSHTGIDTLGGSAGPFGNGLIYSDIGGSTLTPGNQASITVTTPTGTEGQSVVGFRVDPVDAKLLGSVSLNILDVVYDGMTVALSLDPVLDGGDLQTTVSAPGTYSLSGVLGVSPFYIIFDFTTITSGLSYANNSFAYDVVASAVPLPAGVALIGTAFVGAGLFSRRRKNAASA